MNLPKEWNAAALLELSGSHWPSCALQAAVELGVFTALGDQSSGAEDLAGRLGCDRRALEMLLDALAAMRLLEKEGGRYANVPSARRYLAGDSPEYLGNILKHHFHLLESWSGLDRAVRSGQPLRDSSRWSQEAWRESFLLGMVDLARQVAPRLLPHIDLAGRRRLLDLGGGPGAWAGHFCRHNPQLRATVVDLPATRPYAQRIIGEFGLADRIDFQAADFLAEEIPGRYDAAWLSHILHGEGPEGCAEILRKAVSVLEPGGMILVHEFILDDDRRGPPFAALFSLNMLLATTSGQSYTEQEIGAMLSRAGVSQVRRLPLPETAQSGILVGQV